ncbi:response regulator [Brachyspira hyodysenteriae]|uniref:protein-glutamate methylesterase n=3 Tax=Brachyspira hyodysenteriae TaxID=159 RepID=A0A3B6VCT0_BRAHW|nr:chemotaxis protein CheB [Brachyspira hyodysenteriae]ACN84627.1 putative chemotaxis response regulator containing a CheY-like receiver domain and a methylesterase domain [Brachyspira hyodysenteriae WA1]ANN63298.1 chemotaxis response regulator protein-glutamate methylesterase [Brachyspira hyodysenteriae ATCC 27164]AUJ50362.1 chemotaxis response regulator protein-glutamate methylesterase [Brachyspira hyodysenteriae]KLI13888.1 chemotaxis protein [Brachyspira hyodysenteriae]KLI14568.1 chemotaxis
MLGAIRVLIAEDSKATSALLNNVLANHYRIEVVSIVNNGIDAYKSIVAIKPDFVVMNIDLPLMGGIELLKLLKKENIQTNILVMSSLAQNKDLSSRALDLGALDIIYKPRNINADFIRDNILNIILETTKNNPIKCDLAFDYNASILNSCSIKEEIEDDEKTYMDKFDDNVRIMPYDQKQVATALSKTFRKDFKAPILVAIGISTGGPRALRIMLPSLPKDFPLPILISQHIPKEFSSSLISSLQDISKIKIKEAQVDEEILPSIVYISPGDKNMGIYMDSKGKLRIKFYPDPDKKFVYTPCVDYLFNTIDDVLKDKAIAIVMTGMGNDGTSGMTRLYNDNNLTIAQDKASCTVYGMPRSVIENKVVHLVLSLYDIAEFLVQYLRGKLK